MDYSSGYVASYYATFVDPLTFEDDIRYDSNRIEVLSGSINKDNSLLRQSASIILRNNYTEINDRWIRIYMILEQSKDKERIPLFTGLASSPNLTYNLGVQDQTLNCYSVLKVAEDVIMPRGWYALAGTNIGSIINELFSVLPAEVVIADNIPSLEVNVVAENNESNLSMVDYILSIIDWQMQIDGSGVVYIYPKSNDPVSIFSPYDNDIIQADSFSIGRDWFDCPNVLCATSGTNMAIAKDENPDSDLSISARGREVWATEDNVALEDKETLASYAKKRLTELQTKTETVQYTRRFVPTVNQGDMVRINYPEIQGDYRVESQVISLTATGQTSENVFKIYGDEVW